MCVKLVEQTRCDLGRMDATWTEDPNTGFVHFSAVTAKPGILTYHERQDDGSIKTVRELVTKEVLHSPKVLNSLNSKAVLNEHHYDETGKGVMVRTDNAKELMAGFTKDTHRIDSDGLKTRIDGVITDPSLIQLVKSGKKQTSPGYSVKIKQGAGEHPIYGRYDQEQVDRDYNHFSITWRGRAGEDVRIDSEDDEVYQRFDGWQIETEDTKTQESVMQKITINGHEVEVSEAAAIAYSAEKTRVDSEFDTLNSKLESANSEKEKVQGRVDALENELADAVKFRADSQLKEIQEQASKILKDVKFDSMTAVDIKQAVVKAKYPNKDLTGISADRLDGMYDIAIESAPAAESRTDSFTQAQTVYQNAERVDSDPVNTAYLKQIQKMTEGRV